MRERWEREAASRPGASAKRGRMFGPSGGWGIAGSISTHSIAQNAIEWGTPIVWATRQNHK